MSQTSFVGWSIGARIGFLATRRGVEIAPESVRASLQGIIHLTRNAVAGMEGTLHPPDPGGRVVTREMHLALRLNSLVNGSFNAW